MIVTRARGINNDGNFIDEWFALSTQNQRECAGQRKGSTSVFVNAITCRHQALHSDRDFAHQRRLDGLRGSIN